MNLIKISKDEELKINEDFYVNTDLIVSLEKISDTQTYVKFTGGAGYLINASLDDTKSLFGL